MNLKNTLKLAAALVLASAIPAFAGDIAYVCDPSVAVATCNYLNTVVANQYATTFTNASADIYIQYGTTGLASTTAYPNDETYTAYVAALTANSNMSAVQTSALAALNTYALTPYGSGNVELSAALATNLGFTGLTGIEADGSTSCLIGASGCYDAVVTVTNDPGTPLYYDNLGGSEASDEYDFYATVEHETDEVLGTSSCISTQAASLSDGCDGYGAGTPSAVDLFRYSSAGNLVLDSSLSTTAGAYFSYNGGVTNGANGFLYNTLSNGDDYGDFVNACPAGPFSIQDAEGCPGNDAGQNILNDGGAEINLLNAVGYDLPLTSTTPEPGTIVLLASGIGALLELKRRRRRP